MKIELSDLLDRIGKNIRLMETWEDFYRDARANPNKYKLSEMDDRIELRQIGEQDIPIKGRVLVYADNDFYNHQSPEFQAKYPELNTETPTAIAELVKEVYLKSEKGQVEIIITKYLIKLI